MRRALAAAALAAVLAACGGDEPRAQPTGSASPSPTPTASATTATPSPPASPTSSPVSGAPSPVEPSHGGNYWGVYLAAGDPTSQEFMDRLALLESKGLPSESHDVNCDQGAAEALAISDEEQVVGVYFASEASAKAWASKAPVDVLAVAKVTTYCLD